MLAGIAHVPEGRQIFAGLTVEENLRLGAYAQALDAGALAARMDAVCRPFPVLQERRREAVGPLLGCSAPMPTATPTSGTRP